MLAEHGNISVGIDLGRDYSQIAFCSKSDRAPLMVMQSEEEKEENDYLIRTPAAFQKIQSTYAYRRTPEGSVTSGSAAFRKLPHIRYGT